MPGAKSHPAGVDTVEAVKVLVGDATAVVEHDVHAARDFPPVRDLDRGVAYENFYRLDGIHTGGMTLGPGHPAPSQEEIQEAYDIARADPEFERLFKRFRVVLEGGFILMEDKGKPCGPGSRCLRVFLLSSDRAGTIRQVVVDLVKQQLAYDDFSPESRRNDR